MSYVVMKPAWEADLDCASKLILISLADQANDNGECYPSVSHLEKRTGLARATIFKHLNALETAGHISRDSRLGRSTVYTVHPVESTITRLPSRPVHVVDPSTKQTPPVHEVDTTRPRGRPRIITESLNNHKEAKSPKTERQKKALIPTDWSISDSLRAWAKLKRPDCTDTDLENLRTQMIDYHRSKGNTFLDFDATFRTWCTNDLKFNGANAKQNSNGIAGNEWVA
jgi:hypothetical protein